VRNGQGDFDQAISFPVFGQVIWRTDYTVKKVSDFPVPGWMSLTKLSLAGNSLIIPCQGEFG
jgi:hypothetical protein